VRWEPDQLERTAKLQRGVVWEAPSRVSVFSAPCKPERAWEYRKCIPTKQKSRLEFEYSILSQFWQPSITLLSPQNGVICFICSIAFKSLRIFNDDNDYRLVFLDQPWILALSISQSLSTAYLRDLLCLAGVSAQGRALIERKAHAAIRDRPGELPRLIKPITNE